MFIHLKQDVGNTSFTGVQFVAFTHLQCGSVCLAMTTFPCWDFVLDVDCRVFFCKGLIQREIYNVRWRAVYYEYVPLLICFILPFHVFMGNAYAHLYTVFLILSLL